MSIDTSACSPYTRYLSTDLTAAAAAPPFGPLLTPGSPGGSAPETLLLALFQLQLVPLIRQSRTLH